MEVRTGYTQTDIGVVPDDWQVVSIGSIACFTSGQGINIANLTEKSSDSPIPVYGGNGIAGYTSAALTHDPTIVVGRVGQKCGEVYLTNGPAWITDNALYPRRFLRRPDMRFFALAMQAAGLNRVKNRNDLPLVTQSILHSKLICLPLTETEQRAIAAALSDVDALLGGLDRLIAKKRDFKQAAMQQLLTGQTRLPGFHGAWEVKALGELSSMKSGEAITSANIDAFSTYPCYGGNGLRGHTSHFTHDGQFALIGRQGALCGNVVGVEGKFFASEHAVVATPNSKTDIRWLTYVLATLHLNRYSESSAQPGLSVSKILMLDAIVPPTKAEQAAIATVLSDMDAELSALEARRDKTRALKQAMMQELLTGRTRLV